MVESKSFSLAQFFAEKLFFTLTYICVTYYISYYLITSKRITFCVHFTYYSSNAIIDSLVSLL